MILFRQGEYDDLRRVLGTIDRGALVRKPTNAAILAYLLSATGQSRAALEVLYDARRANRESADAHLQYIVRYPTLRRGIDQPEVAGPEVAVEILGSGAPGWVLLTSSDADAGQSEYALDHPTARAVQGRRTGEPVAFPENPRIHWSVGALDTKFAFAFRQSLTTYPARFPTERGLEQHEVPDGDPDQFREQLRARLVEGEPLRAALHRSYAEGRTTLGSIATVLGLSSVEAIHRILATRTGLIAARGAGDGAQAAESLGEPDVELVLDVSACFVLDAVGALRGGPLARRKLSVAQSTIDEFRAELSRWNDYPSEGFPSIAHEAGQLVRVATTGETVQAARAHFESLLTWLRGNVLIRPITSSTYARQAAHREVGHQLGHSFWDSMLVASEPGRLLVSDDAVLRQLYLAEFSGPSVSSASLLQKEATDGVIAKERYEDIALRLLCMRYRYIPTDVSVVVTAARNEAWRPQGSLALVLEVLNGPVVNVQWATILAAQFFRAIWLEGVERQKRENLYTAVLSALCTERQVAEALPIFRACLQASLGLLPFALVETLRTLDVWTKVRAA